MRFTPKLMCKMAGNLSTLQYDRNNLALNEANVKLTMMREARHRSMKIMAKKVRADKAINNKYVKEEYYLKRKYLLAHPIIQLLGKSSKNMLAYETFCDSNAVRNLKDFQAIPTFQRKKLVVDNMLY